MAKRSLFGTRPPYRVKLSRRFTDVEASASISNPSVESFTPKASLPTNSTPSQPTKWGGGGGLSAEARLPAPPAGPASAHERLQAPASACEREVRRNPTVKENPTVENLLTLASTLTAKQRQELLDQLALTAQISRGASQDRDLDMWSAAVYDALATTDRGEEGGSYGQLLVKRLLSPSSVWRPVQEFMQHAKLNELTVVERRSVYGMLANLLVEHARTISDYTGAPLGPKLVGSCTGNIAGVFEKAFPGYVRAGLAKIAARQLVTRRP